MTSASRLVLLGPAEVHTEEDLRPVLRVVLLGVGLDRDDRVAAVGRRRDAPPGARVGLDLAQRRRDRLGRAGLRRNLTSETVRDAERRRQTCIASGRDYGTCSRSKACRSPASANNGTDALRGVRELAPDVVVMDLNMPGISGVEATRQISMIAPLTRVLVLTISDQDNDVMDAILAGRLRLPPEGRVIDELMQGIRAAAIGESLTRRRSQPRCCSACARRARRHREGRV